jgi:hypothetical protein
MIQISVTRAPRALIAPNACHIKELGMVMSYLIHNGVLATKGQKRELHTHTHTHTQIPHGLAYPEKYRLEGLHQLVQELGMPQSLVLYHQLQMPPPLMEFSLDQQFIEHCNFYHYVQNKLKASISLNH